MHKKWLAPILPYLAVWAGLFLLKSAWGALLGFHLALLIAVWIFRPAMPVRALFQSKHPKWIVVSMLLCGLSGVNVYLFWGAFHIHPRLSAQLVTLGLSESTWLPFIVYFTLVNPLLEEYFWRGFLGSADRHPFMGDLLYAGYHALILWGRVPVASILFALLILSIAGWFWRQIHREDGGLLAPVLGHGAADFTILACIYLQTR